MEQERLRGILERCLEARSAWLAEPHTGAFRLFNGFVEGDPDLVIEVYGQTLVFYNYAAEPRSAEARLADAQVFLLQALPWIEAVLIKTRHSPDPQQRAGVLAYGAAPDRKIQENGVWYALDLTLNHDSSLYLDTRPLRVWAKEQLAAQTVLNTFAYTGSLGVAAQAGGAVVTHVDLNRRFLNLAKESYTLNGFRIDRADFLTGDFWVLASRLIRQGRLFDCVFVDPPFFSVTRAGKVDLVSESHRVINKVRPLVAHEGRLVVINNALYVPGGAYHRMLEGLCRDGYLSMEERIAVPEDITGFEATRVGSLPADPAPFNHSTKIAVLRARRKDERRA